VPLHLRDRVATVSGTLAVEDIEPLVAWLRATPRARVNLRQCSHLHTGALQALLRFGARVSAPPDDPFLATHVLPLLAPATAPTPRSEP